jgi:hypothetical protein
MAAKYRVWFGDAADGQPLGQFPTVESDDPIPVPAVGELVATWIPGTWRVARREWFYSRDNSARLALTQVSVFLERV